MATRAGGVYGSGYPDFGLGVAGEYQFLPWLVTYGNVALIYPVGPITDGNLTLNPMVTQGVSFEARLLRQLSVLIQEELYTSPMHGTGTGLLDGPLVELSGGFNVAVRPVLFQLGIVDNTTGGSFFNEVRAQYQRNQRVFAAPALTRELPLQVLHLLEIGCDLDCHHAFLLDGRNHAIRVSAVQLKELGLDVFLGLELDVLKDVLLQLYCGKRIALKDRRKAHNQVRDDVRIVLLAGNGHVRRDLGVPRWLGAEAPRVFAVGLLEEDDAHTPAAAFDAVLRSAPAERPDPCAGLRARPPARVHAYAHGGGRKKKEVRGRLPACRPRCRFRRGACPGPRGCCRGCPPGQRGTWRCRPSRPPA